MKTESFKVQKVADYESLLNVTYYPNYIHATFFTRTDQREDKKQFEMFLNKNDLDTLINSLTKSKISWAHTRTETLYE